MSPEDVIYTGTDESWHLSQYSYRCLLKMEDINHQSWVVPDSNYMFTVHGMFSVGMELNRFPSGWGRSHTLARPTSYEKSHISLCHATREFTLWNSPLHFITLTSIHVGDQSGKSRTFLISAAQLCMLLLSCVQLCLIGQMVQVLML